MKIFGITKLSIIPRSMWRAQLANYGWKLVDFICVIVIPFAFCLWLKHVIHPYIVQAVNYIEAVAIRTMN